MKQNQLQSRISFDTQLNVFLTDLTQDIFCTGQYNPVGPKDSQSLTLCLNSTKIVETLENVMVKARAMYDAGAYLHWFWKHGCSKVTAGFKVF